MITALSSRAPGRDRPAAAERAAPRRLPGRSARRRARPRGRRPDGRAREAARARRAPPRQRGHAARHARGGRPDRAAHGQHAGGGRRSPLASRVGRADVVGHVRARGDDRAARARQLARRERGARERAARHRRRGGGGAGRARGSRATPPTACRRASCWTASSTRTARSSSGRARSCRSRARRCWSRAWSRRSPASGCSTCAPRRARRRRTSPRSCGNDGEVVAVEKHGGRAKALAENCERLGATCVSVREADAVDVDGEFDRVLLDPPCSDLGTLQSRPDVRWKKDEEVVRRLAAEQERLLDVAADRVRPGGTLVYSTCTISPDENERQIDRFLDRRGEFRDERARAAAAAPGRHRRLLHRPHDEGGLMDDRDQPGPRVPVLQGAVAAPDQPARPLPLRLLPAPLRAALGLPRLRLPRHDRADDRRRQRDLPQLRRVDADDDLERPSRKGARESRIRRPAPRNQPVPVLLFDSKSGSRTGAVFRSRRARRRPGCRSGRRSPTAGRTARCRPGRCC